MRKYYLTYYLLKGDRVEEVYSLRIGDLNIHLINYRIKETFGSSGRVEEPYIILEIKGITFKQDKYSNETTSFKAIRVIIFVRSVIILVADLFIWGG